MKTFLPDQTPSIPSSLKIKGRMIPHEEFTARLKNFCASLGFRRVKISSAGSFFTTWAASPGTPEGVATEDVAVLILSCRVSYNPNWGGYSGLPQLLVRERADTSAEQCPAGFIDPFLQQYRFAKDHIFLTETEQGRHLITVPQSFLKKDGKNPRLILRLDKIAEPDKDGTYSPVMISGSMTSYALSESFLQVLAARRFVWKSGRSIPIDSCLGSELFFFAGIDLAVDQNSRICATLLPHLNRIVTHRTPHLRAAEIHLRQEFARALETFTAHHPESGNVLCLAGLDIDMTAFKGQGEQYFVPWKAYLERAGRDLGEECALEQDDLFVRLMQQEKLCSV